MRLVSQSLAASLLAHALDSLISEKSCLVVLKTSEKYPTRLRESAHLATHQHNALPLSYAPR